MAILGHVRGAVLYRRSGRREPFGKCRSDAWRMPKDIGAGELRLRTGINTGSVSEPILRSGKNTGSMSERYKAEIWLLRPFLLREGGVKKTGSGDIATCMASSQSPNPAGVYCDEEVESQMSPEEINLLKEEYFHLQKTVEDFDQRGLTIKAWSVTTSMAGIAAAFLHKNVDILIILSAISALTFWIIEAMWKSFQQCYYPRLRAIEKAFADQNVSEKPLQISSSWHAEFHRHALRRFFRAFLWPHVSLPHVLIVTVGVLFWVLRFIHWAPAH